MSRISLAASALAIYGAIASIPAAAAQRVFVASHGSDANVGSGCVLSNPCRGFTAALTVVDPGGEIVALDAAGYGAVAITKSVTLTANPGYFAGIAASSGNAVTIATAGVEVILRGLNINGIGATHGVVMTDGASLSIENCIISNFATDGVQVSAPARVRVADSVIRGMGSNGVYVSNGATASVSKSGFTGNGFISIYVDGTPAATTTRMVVSDATVTESGFVGAYATGVAGATVKMSVTRSTLSHNGIGIGTDGVGTVTVTSSYNLVTDNSTSGLYQGGIAVHESQGNNTVRQNGANTTGIITGVAGL